jgi:hypothetical protein
MALADFLVDLGDRKTTTDEVAERVVQNSELVSEIIRGLTSDNARIRLGCAKILRTVSERKPEALYPISKYFVTLLDHRNNIIKWNAMDILANLACVDDLKNFDKIFDKYFSLLEDKVLVTAAHVVDNSGKIAKAKPYFTDRITNELLRVEKIPRDTECKNILKGKTILAFDAYFNQIEDKEMVITFVKKQLRNRRNATKTKAKNFLKKHDN